jgi:hypothetical protein
MTWIASRWATVEPGCEVDDGDHWAGGAATGGRHRFAASLRLSRVRSSGSAARRSPPLPGRRPLGRRATRRPDAPVPLRLLCALGNESHRWVDQVSEVDVVEPDQYQGSAAATASSCCSRGHARMVTARGQRRVREPLLGGWVPDTNSVGPAPRRVDITSPCRGPSVQSRWPLTEANR